MACLNCTSSTNLEFRTAKVGRFCHVTIESRCLCGTHDLLDVRLGEPKKDLTGMVRGWGADFDFEKLNPERAESKFLHLPVRICWAGGKLSGLVVPFSLLPDPQEQ